MNEPLPEPVETDEALLDDEQTFDLDAVLAEHQIEPQEESESWGNYVDPAGQEDDDFAYLEGYQEPEVAGPPPTDWRPPRLSPDDERPERPVFESAETEASSANGEQG
ncbi:hypothetical protein [Lignipirellula cremea]|uniref:Uncharacterized protein n=1 Tax=Lignipirellula cremea TaxID=2528010 RepID=A0A518DRR6_9BACT|nr:hypothetical protein [Lignipirellula cremea]QDU94535.1 hypothetical protein Pla8534_23260 [Lignipirellula cremea]